MHQKKNKIGFYPNILIGKSRGIKRVMLFVKKVCPIGHPVLIAGQTGVGKELVAQCIHNMSPRKNKPFIKINCANIPYDLVESELFGYKKGAFTDARSDKLGLLEEGNEGSLFFDEISELPLNIQAKLLRVIENQEIRRLGDTKEKKINIRFIFATNKDLRREIKEGRFREDLYYRIGVLNLYIPPLKDRKEDIPLLIDRILEKENLKNIIISEEALKKLLKYDYPGNIRELNTIIIRACTFSNKIEIKEKDIMIDKEEELNKNGKQKKYSIQIIKHALKSCGGNKTKASKELGISRRHLYRLLDKYGMSHPIEKRLF